MRWARTGSGSSDGRSLLDALRVSFRTSVGPSRSSYRSDFEATLHDLLDRLPAGSTIAELGAGANLVLAAEPRVLSGELTLYMVDISQAELDKAPAVGEKLCLAVAVPDLPLSSSVDLACSQMLGGAQVAGAGSPPCAGVVQLPRLCGGTAARMTSRDTMILLRAV